MGIMTHVYTTQVLTSPKAAHDGDFLIRVMGMWTVSANSLPITGNESPGRKLLSVKGIHGFVA
jgi:hypothetical protein